MFTPLVTRFEYLDILRFDSKQTLRSGAEVFLGLASRTVRLTRKSTVFYL